MSFPPLPAALNGHNTIDPAHINNHTGHWLADGLTYSQWYQEATTKLDADDREGFHQAQAIGRALYHLDARYAEDQDSELPF